MSYQERQCIVNIFSALLITIIFALLIYQKQEAGIFDLTQDYRKWGVIFLIFIGISIGARIIILIIFNILNAIATQETDIPISDERDKLIKLKSTRNAHYVLSITFFLMFPALALGMPLIGIFIYFIAAGFLTEIVDNGSQIYFYRKGV